MAPGKNGLRPDVAEASRPRRWDRLGSVREAYRLWGDESLTHQSAIRLDCRGIVTRSLAAVTGVTDGAREWVLG